MTEPARRHTVDTITSDALDQLYAERDEWRRQARAERSDCRIAEEESRGARQAEAEQRQRANRVEGERGDLLVKLAAVRADRDRWRDQARTEQADRRDAEAAIERVRKALASFDGRGILGDPRCFPIPTASEVKDAIRAALDEHQEQPATAEQRAEETPDRLAHVGWWCWRGDNHGHLTTTPCRSDNVPLHAPTEWADDMRAVIQRIEDGDDEEEQP